ncbi:hypothetical protein A1O3_06376 [Capronia epimyces CBS 606.96]|uniref:Centromere protein L n=1 Tax=Capronia epimyces CBS 606.96 TaxID=1182542 RepID=W9XQR6_9EURO|nr:uncharacterized protein A1O3_06376 [Capronia epimyces CBS 606.96]EXJ82563.1 hypothetical protein A1O3_06376 [Capronia epimyces CBS 606.96]
MDDLLYDTSWLLHTVPHLTPALCALSDPSISAVDELQHQFSHHADALRVSLGKDRPRYEEVEEKEKLGGLKQCTWRRLRSTLTEETSVVATKRKRDNGQSRSDSGSNSTPTDGHGLVISLVYEKATYKFIIYTSNTSSAANSKGSKRSHTGSSTRPRLRAMSDSTATCEPAILLSKSSPAAFKAVTAYLVDSFALPEIGALKLPSAVIQTTLERYLTSVSTSLGAMDIETSARRSVFHSIVGTLRITISFMPPVAPSLKTIDISIPPYTVEQQYQSALDEGEEGQADRQVDFMSTVAAWILTKTGLNINPSQLTSQNNDDSDKENTPAADPAVPSTHAREEDRVSETPGKSSAKTQSSPMRISRISTGAYAISIEGRLKFASKPVEIVDGISEEGEGDDKNLVRRANEGLLRSALEETRKQAREEG